MRRKPSYRVTKRKKVPPMPGHLIDSTKRGMSACHEVNLGANYSQEEIEFLSALQAYMKREKRKFPAFTEIFRIVRELGYRKVTNKEPTS